MSPKKLLIDPSKDGVLKAGPKQFAIILATAMGHGMRFPRALRAVLLEFLDSFQSIEIGLPVGSDDNGYVHVVFPKRFDERAYAACKMAGFVRQSGRKELTCFIGQDRRTLVDDDR